MVRTTKKTVNTYFGKPSAVEKIAKGIIRHKDTAALATTCKALRFRGSSTKLPPNALPQPFQTLTYLHSQFPPSTLSDTLLYARWATHLGLFLLVLSCEDCEMRFGKVQKRILTLRTLEGFQEPGVCAPNLPRTRILWNPLI